MLGHNGLWGTLPSGLGLLSSCRSLSVERNALQGRIPDGLDVMSRLSDLSLQMNQLAGPVPEGMGVMSLVAQIARCNRDVRCDSNRAPPNR